MTSVCIVGTELDIAVGFVGTYTRNCGCLMAQFCLRTPVFSRMEPVAGITALSCHVVSHVKQKQSSLSIFLQPIILIS